MQTIKAKNLASGDVVRFPRLGTRTILRLSGKSETSVQIFCDDRKRRMLPIEQEVSAEIKSFVPVAIGADELFRLDLETNRVSIISEGSFLFSHFDDVRDGFDGLRVRVSATRENIALAEIRRGAAFYTPKAIYAKEVAKLWA